MIYPGGEYSTAIMVPGTLFVLMAGRQLEMKQELSVKQQAKNRFISVNSYDCMWKGFIVSTEAAVVNYGRGNSPILPFSIQCDSLTTSISNCSKKLDTTQCTNVAAIDCRGVFYV